MVALASLPAWVYWQGILYKMRWSPFGSELGSMAYPIPTYLSVIGLYALITAIVAFFVIIRDLTQWLRKRRDRAGN